MRRVSRVVADNVYLTVLLAAVAAYVIVGALVEVT